MRKQALAAIAAGAVVFAVLFIGYATRERRFVSAVPQPPPLVTLGLVPLPPSAEACIAPIVIDGDADRARIQVGTFGRLGPALRITASGQAYRAVARVPGGYADNAVLTVPIRAPARATVARLCVQNVGRRRAGLYASGDTLGNRAVTRVNGRAVKPVFMLVFDASPRATLLARWPSVASRITVFRPGWVQPWLVWALALAVVIAVPALLAWEFVSAAARDDRVSRAGPGAGPGEAT